MSLTFLKIVISGQLFSPAFFEIFVLPLVIRAARHCSVSYDNKPPVTVLGGVAHAQGVLAQQVVVTSCYGYIAPRGFGLSAQRARDLP